MKAQSCLFKKKCGWRTQAAARLPFVGTGQWPLKNYHLSVSGSSILGGEAACWSSASQPISPCGPRRPEVERSLSSGRGKPSATCQWRLWPALFFPRQLGAARVGGEWHSQTGLAHLSSCAWHGCLVSKQLQWVTAHLQIVNDTFVLCVHCHRGEGKKWLLLQGLLP